MNEHWLYVLTQVIAVVLVAAGSLLFWFSVYEIKQWGMQIFWKGLAFFTGAVTLILVGLFFWRLV